MEKTINRVGLSWVYDQIKLDLVNIYNLLNKNLDENLNTKCKEIDNKLCHIAKVFYLLNISGGVSFINEFRLNLKFLTLTDTIHHDKITATADKVEQVLNYIEDIIQGYGDLPIYYVATIDHLRIIRDELLFSQCSYIVNNVKQQNISGFDCEFDSQQKNNISTSLVYLLKNTNTEQKNYDKLIKNIHTIRNQFKGTEHYILWDIISGYYFLSKNYNVKTSHVAGKLIRNIIEEYNTVFDTLNFEKLSDVIPNWIASLSFDLVYSGYFNFLDKKLCKFISKVIIIQDKKTLTNYMRFAERMIGTDSWILLLDISSELDLAINKLQDSKNKKRVDINWLLDILQKHIDSCVLTGTYEPLEYYYQSTRKIGQYTITGGFISSDDLALIEEVIIDLTKNVEYSIQSSKEEVVLDEDLFAHESKSVLDQDARRSLLNQQIKELDDISTEILIKSRLASQFVITKFKEILGIFKLIEFEPGQKLIHSYLEKLVLIAKTDETVSDSLKQNIIVFIKYLTELIKALNNGCEYDFHIKSLYNLINSLEVASIGNSDFTSSRVTLEDDESPSSSSDDKNKKSLVLNNISEYSEKSGATAQQLRKDSHFDEQIQVLDKVNAVSANSSTLKQIFFEEFVEINESITKIFTEWKKAANNQNAIETMQRELHTLKGAARMVGFFIISDWMHYLEGVLDSCYQHIETLSLVQIKQFEHEYNKALELVGAYKINLTPAQPVKDEIDFSINDPSNSEVSTGLSIASLLKATQEPRSEHNKTKTAAGHPIPLRDVVRVNKDELDELLDSACELSISQHQLNQQNNYFSQVNKQLYRVIDTISNNPIDHIKQLNLLAKQLQELQYNYHNVVDNADRNVNHVFNKLINLRMVPLSAIRERLLHLADSIANELNKEISFSIKKSEGSVDCVVLEQITPSLDHLIRNAISHGIEQPAQRLRIGKNTTGTIELNLYTQEQFVVIELSDDGGGIDLEKVTKKAKNLGLIEPDTKITVNEVLPIISNPGFSTAENISQISGRGIGLNIVKDTVTQLCGTLEVDSSPHAGTKFTIKLPYSLAKQQLVFIKLADLHYAIPSLIVKEVQRVPGADIHHFSGNYIYKDTVVYNLYDLLNLDSNMEHGKVDPDQNYNLIVINHKNSQFGLLVEEVCETRESVVRPLSEPLRKITEFMGGTIYQDGRVVLVLDVINIFNSIKKQKTLSTLTIPVNEIIKNERLNDIGLESNPSKVIYRTGSPVEDSPICTEAVEEGSPDKVNVFMVEDSATVRHAVSNYLSRVNYNVTFAVDGLEGLKKLRTMDNIPDLILLDISMPRMNGIEFLKRVRNMRSLKNTPVIIMSSRDEANVKEAAMQLNVDIFLKKPYDQERLVNAINYVLE